MKFIPAIQALRTVVALAFLAMIPTASRGQSVDDAIDVVRSSLKADREVALAGAMQFSDQESQAFWPLYSDYRAKMDDVGNGLVTLLLEYADAYRAGRLDESRADEMLKRLTTLEKELVSVRATHARKFRKVLPASKVLRFLQVENRLDLLLRIKLAAAVPLVPQPAQ